MHNGSSPRRDREDEDGALALDLKNLKVISALGRGAKGVVFLVQNEIGELLALKAILRSSVEKRKPAMNGGGNDYRRICFEREVLASFHHPLLPKLHGVLRTDKIVGYAIDFCSGRDLNSLRKKQTEKMFSDDIIRFYAAELVLALEYLHDSGIVYRDLKPENVMIQENGHLMLVDFDLSTKLPPKSPETRSLSSDSGSSPPQIAPLKKDKFGWLFKCRRRDSDASSPDGSARESDLDTSSVSSNSDSVEKSNSFVGTEEYVAPEIILGDGHDFSVDWWCLGVMLYEMLYGTTPFRGSDRKETFYRIITKAPDLTGEVTPLRDLIGKLLEKDPGKRISLVREIKGHRFFGGVEWDRITEMPRPPFIPELTDVEGMGGNKEIDVESYVQGVFKVGDEGKSGNNDKSIQYLICEENKSKDVWVNYHPTQIQNENFLIF